MVKMNLVEYIKFGGKFEDLTPKDIIFEEKLSSCFSNAKIVKIVEGGKNSKGGQLYDVFFIDNTVETLHGQFLDIEIEIKPKRGQESSREKALKWWNDLCWTDKGLLMEGDFKHSHPQGLINSEIEKLWILNNPDVKTRKLYCWLSEDGKFSNSWNETTHNDTIGKDIQTTLKNASDKNWKLIEYTILNNKHFEFYNAMRLA